MLLLHFLYDQFQCIKAANKTYLGKPQKKAGPLFFGTSKKSMTTKLEGGGVRAIVIGPVI